MIHFIADRSEGAQICVASPEKLIQTHEILINLEQHKFKTTEVVLICRFGRMGVSLPILIWNALFGGKKDFDHHES